MPEDRVVRVVVVRGGKVRPTEFRLRDGELGLSLFCTAQPGERRAVLAAVRAAGKQGELRLAELPVPLLHRLGLRLVRTPGGTADPEVNALHIEARPSWWRRLALRLRGVPIHQWFNERATPELAAAAKLLE